MFAPPTPPLVRKGDHLLGTSGIAVPGWFRMAAEVVVVAGGEGFPKHHAEQVGRPRPDDDERFAGVAEVAISAQDEALGAGGKGFRAEQGHQLTFAAACAGGAVGTVPGMEVAAVAAPEPLSAPGAEVHQRG